MSLTTFSLSLTEPIPEKMVGKSTFPIPQWITNNRNAYHPLKFERLAQASSGEVPLSLNISGQADRRLIALEIQDQADNLPL